MHISVYSDIEFNFYQFLGSWGGVVVKVLRY